MTAVDAGAADAGLWLTISDIARRKGVSKQAISKRVERLMGQGLIATRDGPRGAKLVNLAAYDRASGETIDAIRELAQAPPVASSPAPFREGDPVLAREQARRVAYQADLAKLDLDERLGKLLPIDQVTAAMVRCAEALTRSIDQMPSRAEDLAAAVAKDGVNGARAFLKTIARDLRSLLARELRLLQAEGLAAEASTSPGDEDG